MKRLIGFSISIILGMSCAFAQGDTDVTINAYRNGETITAESISGEKAVLSVYDDGVLCYSTMAVTEDNEYIFNVPSKYDGMRMRICCIGEDTYEVVMSEAPSEEVTDTPTEAPTETPTETPTPVPTRTPVPEAYEKSLDALHAPAVVMDLTETIIDGETYYSLTMLYQGNVVTTNVRDWVEIKSAPTASAYLIGQKASALDEGDVIHFNNDLQGRIKSIEFIYRPDFNDYVSDGIDFDTVLGKDGYSSFKFGVPVDKSKGTISIADENGTVTEIDVNSKAFVYLVSDEKRRDIVSLEGTGTSSVVTTYVQKDNFDDDGNVISWDDVDDRTYALVRIVNGSATEIILFGE